MAVPVLVTAGRKVANSGGVNSYTITVDTPDAVRVGDVLIAFISIQATAPLSTSLQVPAGWTRVDTYRSGIRTVGVCIKVLKTQADVLAQPASQTWGNDGTTRGRYSGAIYRVTGVNLDAPIDGAPSSWASDHKASDGNYASMTASVPAPDSLGLGMFYAHTASGDSAPTMSGAAIIDHQLATDQNTQSTSTFVVFTVPDASNATILHADSGTYATSSGMQLSLASANPSEPNLGLYRIGYAKDSIRGAATSIMLTANNTLRPGDWILATIAVSSAAAGETIASPAGWTELFYEGLGSGTYKTYLFTKQVDDSGKDFTFTLENSAGRGLSGSLMWFRDCAPPARWIIGPFWHRGGDVAQSTTVRARGLTTKQPDTLVLSFGIERTLLEETGVSGVSGGASEWFFAEQKSSSQADTTQWWGWQEVTTPRATTDTIISYPNPQNINGWGMQIAIPGLTDPGYGIKYWDGTAVQDAHVYLKGVSGLITPSVIRAMPDPQYTVAKMLAEQIFYWAHRGGGDDWPEMTMHAYTQSALWGAKCLEVSVYRTSDGVWVGSHDPTTLRTTGQDLDIRSSTWAQLSSLTTSAVGTSNPAQPRRPLVRMTDILEAYGQSHVIILDNKAVERTVEFLDIMEHYDPTHERLIWKGFRTGTTAPYLAQARGFKTWGYMYDDDATNAALDLGCWDILGLNYNATQAQWDAIKLHGKPVVGHVINSAAAAAMALSKGADGLQCSNVKQAIPPMA